MSGQPVALYIALSVMGGIFVPIAAALSGALGRGIGNPFAASLIVMAGACAAVLLFALLTGSLNVPLDTLRRVPPLQFAAGLGIAFYLISITYVGPRLGVGNAVMLVVAAQIVCSAAIDQFALFGAPHKPIDLMRALGLSIMTVGVVIAQLAANKPAAH